MNDTAHPLTVYYDNSCPICREEIGALKSIDHLDNLTLIDCSDPQFDDDEATKAGLTQKALKNAMHVRDSEGTWHVAADAFIAMYDTVGFDAAAKLLRKQRVRSLFEWVYPIFVKHRHKLRYLGIHKIMPWIIKRSAARQAAKTQQCATSRNSKPG